MSIKWEDIKVGQVVLFEIGSDIDKEKLEMKINTIDVKEREAICEITNPYNSQYYINGERFVLNVYSFQRNVDNSRRVTLIKDVEEENVNNTKELKKFNHYISGITSQSLSEDKFITISVCACGEEFRDSKEAKEHILKEN